VKPYPWPAQVPPEELGDATVIIVNGSRSGRSEPEIIRATPEERGDLAPLLRILRALPKPPHPERISILVASPKLLRLILEGRLSVGGIEMVERMTGLTILPPDDRWQACGPVLDWVAQLRAKVWQRIHRTQKSRVNNRT